ncbi:aminoglycoside phosphotransferase family protein [Lactobacillus sp. ESL0791]|uniref:aminoglycoside phosphotransferase family protein n=1 Tax=Lactobacillus sp. ESL0791 TaxID=2983234 RepID=UPI0023F8908C|nr:aminoglycoside phosphotransferase family protein [Lactobacillus sp. ESL0791]MDF7639881.1 aminoglycoside phosphotransferase family protein [Lactobacillus sp. ESL0791]
MELKQTLNEKLRASLTPTNHKSLNSTFVGDSQIYQQRIFVKVFAQARKLYAEKMVNQELNDRVLTDFALPREKLLVLVMTDLAPQDVTSTMTPQLAKEMGQVLAKFHTEVKPFAHIRRVDYPLDQVAEKINNLQNIQARTTLAELRKYFLPYRDVIAADLAAHSKIVQHGDVGLRNYKIVGGKLTLIDYEKARLGTAFEDFIKLFYQDLSCDQKLIDAFLQGYGIEKSQWQLKPVTEVYLIYIVALGIMNYTEKIPDDVFRAEGKKMLQTVAEFFRETN